MKVLFFIDGLAAGGKERRLTELMKILTLNPDFNFELVVMNSDIHYSEVLDLNIKIHYLLRKKKKDISIFRKFYKICKNYKPDIVHCWDSMTAVYAVPACKILGTKLVNGSVVDTPKNRTILNKSWLRAKLTFLFSNFIIGNSKSGLAAYNAPLRKSLLIYNGFNFQRINNLTDRDTIRQELDISTKFVIGMVASFSKYKDYKTYFSAAQLILSKSADITFIAIGENTNSIESQNLIDKDYKKRVKTLGRKSNVESYVNAMDICVLSTFTEGTSNSILEYMALKKPVIATCCEGTREIVEDKVTGFLIEPSNPEELVEKITILINDSDLRNQMGMSGFEVVHKKFSIDSMSAQYIRAYRTLL